MKNKEEEEELRTHITAEINEGNRDEIIWQKAMALTGGSEINAQEKYIILRIKQIERGARYVKQHRLKISKTVEANMMVESSLFPYRKVVMVIFILLLFGFTALLYKPGEHEEFKQLAEVVPVMAEVAYEDNRSLKVEQNLSLDSDLVKLCIHPVPDGAKVAIMNIKAKYHDNIELEKGRYQVRVSKPGYQAKVFWIELDADVEKSVSLLKVRYRLYITSIPDDATIKIMNIKEKFKNGMYLLPGRYHIVVEKKGFETKKVWIDLNKEVSSSFQLKPIFFLSKEAMTFSQAYSSCLNRDLRLPSVQRLSKAMAMNKMSDLSDEWFWSSEKSGVIAYKAVLNSEKMPIKSTKLSTKQFVYCVE